MLCDECREREANVHLTKIVNDKKTEAHLCEVCAREKGEDFMMEPSFTFHNILTGLFDPEISQGGGGAPAVTTRSRVRCTNCGLSFADFKRLGHLGCSRCYDQFERQLEPLIRRIHGGTRHTGKVPARTGGKLRVRYDLDKKRQDLQQAVEQEEFERAAQLRDEIRRMERESGSPESGQGGA